TAAHLKGQLYGLEPTGDQTFLSVRTDAMVVEVKADRDFRQPLDTSIAIELDPERLYFFDAESGQRIRLN
ncbi:ABC transporter ATP-binding protein, partial [Mesorhizobium sp. M1C.F.Ca.ET.188.01.1.1]